jgi:hypothetical protein
MSLVSRISDLAVAVAKAIDRSRDRSGHTGTQVAATISDFNTAVAAVKLTPARAILDNLNNPIVACSLDRLWGGYIGAAIKLRRASDGTTLDIGFTADGSFDLAAAIAFIGLGTGTIHTWYDQSGRENHLSQSEIAQQPVLIAAGNLNLFNDTKPGVAFSGNAALAAAAAPMPTSDELNLLIAYKQRIGGVATGAFDFNGNSMIRAFGHMPWVDGNIYWDLGDVASSPSNWRIDAVDPIALGTPKLVGFTHSRSIDIKAIWVDDTAIAVGVASNSSIAANQMTIGHSPAYGIGLEGAIAEIWLYDRVPSNPEQIRIINSIKSRYI